MTRYVHTHTHCAHTHTARAHTLRAHTHSVCTHTLCAQCVVEGGGGEDEWRGGGVERWRGGGVGRSRAGEQRVPHDKACQSHVCLRNIYLARM